MQIYSSFYFFLFCPDRSDSYFTPESGSRCSPLACRTFKSASFLFFDGKSVLHMRNKLRIVFSLSSSLRQSKFFLLGGISEPVERWVLCRLVSQNACTETDFGSPSLLQRPQCCTGRVGFILPCSLREWEGICTASSTRPCSPR